jgi:hypothetical protein
VAEAEVKKIKAGDFAAFWLKKHNELFGGLPDWSHFVRIDGIKISNREAGT